MQHYIDARRAICAASLLAASLSLVPASNVNAESTAANTHNAAAGQFLGAKETVYPDWFKHSFLDFEDDIREAATHGKRLLLLFHQDGCPYCNQLVERNLAQKAIRESVQRNFDVVAINMWGDRDVVNVGGQAYSEKSLAAALKVQFTPTLLFFDEQGKIALRLNGYVPPEKFLLALNYVIERREKTETYTDYLARNRPRASSGELRAQAFFAPPPYDLRRNAAQPRPLAVFFEQVQCPDCETLHDQVLVDPATRALIERYDVVQLDLWSNRALITPQGEHVSARDWARTLNVSFAPTIVLFDTQGREVIRSEAYFKIFHTQSLFDYVLSGEYVSTPSFQRFISARAEALRERGTDVNIWQ